VTSYSGEIFELNKKINDYKHNLDKELNNSKKFENENAFEGFKFDKLKIENIDISTRMKALANERDEEKSIF
jgi:hypothetical protein